MATPWDYEQGAADLMRSHLGGIHEVRDPGGGPVQTHDFDLVLDDGRIIATEVTRANVQEQIRDWARIQSRSWRCPNLRSMWLVSFRIGLSVRDAHEGLPGVLERLEAEGIDELDVRSVLSPQDEQFPSDDSAAELSASSIEKDGAEALRSLGVRRVSAIGLGEDGIGDILMNEAPAVGATSPDVVARLAAKTARLPDNLAKLRAAVATERHLFVWVESSRHQVVAAIHGDWLPENDPDVPDEVDAVWLATAYEPSHVWRWSRSAGWEDLGAWRP